MVSIDIPAEKARVVVDALEHDMGSTLATKQDLLVLRQDLEHQIDGVRRDIELLRSSMTVRMGSMLVVAISVLFAALKLT